MNQFPRVAAARHLVPWCGVAKGDEMPVYSFEGKTPELPGADRFWIAPTASVIGQVRLAEDVCLWFGVVIRGDNDLISIGAGTNVQEGTMLHTDPGIQLVVGA